ncbi:non-ribosomal peptide synthetase [Segetibacter sp.]|uniref:non-ribosomal peptide synthetase n=1 Tax=Segetibacter sp. TaxID=2231182 RepID=UPI00260212B2|nr:non-ribosomal peptide synthetase [Segetibacter sp.]
MLPSIEVIRPRPEHIPLSFSQERLWFIDRLEGSVQYHVPAVVRLQGKIDREALGSALQQIVERHEVLRTVFREEEGKAYQVIQESVEPLMQLVDGASLLKDSTSLEKYIKEIIAAPFNLSKDAMLRAHLIVMQEEEHVLVVTLHHIASDGWSRSILVGELAELYASTTEGREAKLIPLPVQYADFSLWQRGYLQGETLDSKLGYWKSKLEGVLPLNLPTDHVRPAVQGTRGGMVVFQIDKKLSEDLLQLSHKHGATMYMTLLSAFNALLYRYSNQEDIAVGTPIAGRLQQELEGLIGFFVNTLTMRSRVDSETTFADLLKQVKITTMEAYANQEIPFEKVVEAVVKDRETYRNPLFQVMFILRNTPDVPELRLGEAALSRSRYQHTTSLFDLSLFITETEHGLNGAFEYSTDIYTRATIERMAAHFVELLQSAVKKPNERVSLLEMVTEQERNQLLADFNNTSAEYPLDETIVDLFEDQAAATPEATALVFEDKQLSYKELNAKSNQLAHYLIAKGVQPETLIPICIERGLEMIIGLLGILKAGAAFVPIDPEYPKDRINHMLEDCGATLVITSEGSRAKLNASEAVDIIELKRDWEIISGKSTEKPSLSVSANQLAYVIYTSGSTGKPKGVMIEHGSLTNLLCSITDKVSFDSRSSFLSVTTYSFDICYLEFYTPLINGGKLIIVSRDVATDGYKLSEGLARYNPTHLQGTPSTWQLLLDSGWQNKEQIKILVGGEAVKESLKDELTQLGDVYNLYGPTETTIWSAIKKLDSTEKVLIGQPLANTNIYILTKEHALCAIGIAGELCIAGAGLARGYLNRPELTSEKFVKDPFSEDEGAKMYKTGDLARWVNDGKIEYLGRIDYQVKIRGYRIELGEIESVLQQSGLVTEAVVIAKHDNQNSRLIGYYTPDLKVLKEKETALYQEQVNSWKDVYDIEYAQHDKQLKDEEFDIGIWKDSFTGSNIPEDQMREWVQDIADVILSEDAGEVLEIGCGTGLIYYQLAGKVKKYIGTDFSASSVNRIKERISKGVKDYGPTGLQVCAAHEINLNGDQKVDTIVINSVVQYFPGEDYMSEVIAKSMSLLRNKGRIIIGDVRDKRLLELFKGRLQLQKLQRSVSVREFNWVVDQEVLKEEELCFLPEYFYNLKSLYPEISHVQITWKHGEFINELSLYRFNVVIYVSDKRGAQDANWVSWNSINDKQCIINRINNGDSVIALKDAPNFRLHKERALDEILKSNQVTTVGEIVDRINIVEQNNLSLTDILEAAGRNKYHCSLLLDENPLVINVLLEKDPSSSFIENVYGEQGRSANTNYTNIPLFTSISSVLQKDIKALLQQKLPDYMVPAEFIALSRLPLTANGKVDRLFLTARAERGVVVDKYSFQAARTIVENKLTVIWQQLLGIDLISVYDNFFDLGGHSLLGMRLISAIRKELEVELSIKDLFNYPTIASLSTHLGLQSQTSLLPSIEAVQPRPANIPLSFSQERLWFIDQLEGTVQYHIPTVLRLKGKINIEALASALQAIVNRHEVLRTVFLEEDGQVYQQIKDAGKWQLSIKDGAELKEQNGVLEVYVHQLINKPFNLQQDDMIRAELINVDVEEHLLVVTLHHIASDGWSTSILVKELVELYEAYDKGKATSLAPLNIQYADFAMWQRSYIKDEVLNNKINYWKQKLQGVEPLQLPTDFARPAIQSTKGAAIGFTINKELTGKLQELSQKQSSTMFMTLLAAFKVLIYRHSGQKDICIGTPIAGRKQQEVENLIGFFVNTLALRDEVSGESSFTEFLQQVKSTTLDAYEHQDVPFEKVVDAVMLQRDMSRSPIFQAMFILQNAPDVPSLRLGEVELSSKGSNRDTAKFDITFSVTETSQGIRGAVEYASELYNEQTIERLITHFKELISSITNNPQESLSLLPMLTQQETHQLLVEFNNTSADYPRDKTIVDLFEEQVERTPDAVAVVFEGSNLSYQRLNERANQLAHYLKAKGVKQETLVPICIERGIDMIVGILGILKAGGAYVPIDAKYPLERIEFMLRDTKARIIITDKESSKKLRSIDGCDLIEIDGKAASEIQTEPTENINIEVTPSNLVYIIYTSGSTGKPKGVMVEHRNVVSLVKGVDYASLTKNDILLSTGSPAFDATTFEFWGMLLNGGQLVLCKEERLLDSKLLKEEIQTRNVNKMWFTSSWFNQLADTEIDIFGALETILVGGEKLSEQHINLVHTKYPAINIINGYGPTENTTFSLTYKISDDANYTSIPIGLPLNNRQAYLFDEHENLVPIGVVGEIYVGGDGLSRGYLNNEALTSEKFITARFDNATRLYKTGDLGKWLANGNIEYLGRKDDQVKIRGYRIELGEIENVIMQSGLVKQCAVVVGEKDGHKRLVGYIVAGGVFHKEALDAYLKSSLPNYMIPVIWVDLESIPLTSNGKLDRKALPEIDLSDSLAGQYIAPASELESKVAEIWQQLLRIERVGVEDNFFELGGDSILTIQVVGRLRRLGYELQPKDLFVHQTVRDLSGLLAKRSGLSITGEQGVLTGECGLLPIQQLYLKNATTSISHFNQSVLLKVEKSVTEATLQNAVDVIMLQHDALRFQYYQKDGEWHQFYETNTQRLAVENLESLTKEELGDGVRKCSEKYQRSLNLEKGELVRVVLMMTSSQEKHNRLLIVIHHFAVDGVSWRILLEDLGSLISDVSSERKQDLGSKGSSYRQWFETLKQYSESSALKEQKKYWEHVVTANYSSPVDKLFSGKVKESSVKVLSMKLGVEETQHLIQEVPKTYQTEVNDILLCALSQTITEWAGTNKVVIGLEGHGREDLAEGIDTSRTVGWFTNLYPVLLDTEGMKTESEWIKGVKRQLRQIPDKGLGFGVLKYINKEASLQKDCWDIVFNYLGQVDTVVAKEGLISGASESAGTNLGEDLVLTEKISINCIIRGSQLLISWRYSSSYYNEETIKIIAERFKDHLQKIIIHCLHQSKKISLLEDLSSNHEEIIKENFRIARTEESNVLVPIRKGDNKLPLYIVCGGGGTVFKFKKMVDLLDPKQTVFGLQQPTNLRQLEEFPETVEKIASIYVSEILAQNPQGPYALSGHCSGGLIAYEMSKQLQAIGKEVKMLAMFDTVAPVVKDQRAQKNTSFSSNYFTSFKRLIGRAYTKLDFELFLLRRHTRYSIGDRLNKFKLLLKKNDSKSEEDKFYEVYKKLTTIIEKAHRNYNMTPHGGKIYVYYAKEHYQFSDINRSVNYKKISYGESIKNRWRNYVDSISIFDIEGEHSTMFDPTIGGGKELAELLQKHLDESINK